MGIDVDLWEIAKTCGKWLKHLINVLNIWEITHIFGKWTVFENRLKNVRNDLDVWEIAQIYGKWLKHFINGLNMC